MVGVVLYPHHWKCTTKSALQKFITLARNNLFISSLEYVSAAILISFWAIKNDPLRQFIYFEITLHTVHCIASYKASFVIVINQPQDVHFPWWRGQLNCAYIYINPWLASSGLSVCLSVLSVPSSSICCGFQIHQSRVQRPSHYRRGSGQTHIANSCHGVRNLLGQD